MVLEDKPIHVRRKIALRITIIVGAILLAILAIIYLSGSNKDNIEKDSAFLHFYATILDNAQSFFSPDRAIIEK
ncbi:MAG: hypothetical protein KBC11_01060 [Candidatus Pacebacteria bacterium]|nr:hypothetical protein [Candidatus Paceibacterota bacterium]